MKYLTSFLIAVSLFLGNTSYGEMPASVDHPIAASQTTVSTEISFSIVPTQPISPQRLQQLLQ